MLFSWADMLTQAERLLRESPQSNTPEADLRSAGRGAYYAAYHHMVEFCQSKGFQLDGRYGDHARVRVHLEQVLKKRSASTRLRQLYYFREQCDYWDEIQDPANVAKSAVRLARELVASFKII